MTTSPDVALCRVSVASPIGSITLVGDEEYLRSLYLIEPAHLATLSTGHPRPLLRAAEQLDAYFAGALIDFDLDILAQGTSFQHQVWDALCTIPYGTTTNYGSIAAAIGRPRAVRAVALAIGANPLAIVVPCHRVIGADGSLTGYASGLERKRFLLDHEQRVLDGS
ncbi:methylated-DNA--[protein]-cysteine S-methyltransferase [Ferrimicrobium sp.]|uniref:methylated-DNA--[protein]-cysteine S-methyltransferase n=1 Tax=Ferrimicrobium sp. TaxID=2926050 RepID=UPI002621ADD5|nr:methylated-DNA--[protein]-cysteine S-methyltransferase [Ferrimicrobium sp.]